MATIGELKFWCFGGARPEGNGVPLPDEPIFRVMAYRFDPERYADYRGEYIRAAMDELPLSVPEGTAGTVGSA